MTLYIAMLIGGVGGFLGIVLYIALDTWRTNRRMKKHDF